ncbi:MAG: tRNA (guanosine(37)-N1)-methyltransferase TrmD [Thermodesulfobacteriota bacterium]
MRFDVLTLFPGFFTLPLRQSIIGKALDSGLIEIHVHNIRDWARDKHRTTDDSPYGGGAGMVMKPEPVASALEAIGARGPEKRPGTVVVLATPQGRPFDQAAALGLARSDRIVVICGRYEGVDERIRSFVDMELSIGDYILTGGEIPALAVIDAVGRLVPGVLGGKTSTEEESFAGGGSGAGGGGGLLEYPQYTRPEEFRSMRVPAVLLSGDHGEIARWRRREAIRRTFQRRPDLLEGADLTDEEREFLKRLKAGPAQGAGDR